MHLVGDTWNTHMRPRLQGTINLHQSLLSIPLDFFLMWSSLTAVFGTATQSNYLASCAFMDSFARYRRRLGLPATSLNLGQIVDTGTVGRNSIFANNMTRNGLYGNDHEEFLQFCDAAITLRPPRLSDDSSSSPRKPDMETEEAQLLAGVGPRGLRRLDKTIPLKDMSWYKDPRFSHMLRAVNYEGTRQSASQSADEAEADCRRPATDRILHRVAQLLCIPASDIDVNQPIVKLGIDSMIAAELRRWLVTVFGEDVSMMEILDGDTNIRKLGRRLTAVEAEAEAAEAEAEA